ncbi:MAG: PD40 domain-containing protein, partial [Bacteroidales bacterium]|nr:PD40 domain-containing protein [Bacteroidales bacterium]
MVRNISILVFLVILCSCTSNNQEEKQGLEPIFSSELTTEEIEGGRMTAEILWKFGRIHEAQVSPDSKNILYRLTRYDPPTNKSNTDIYRIPFEGGNPIQITSFKGHEFNHRWHPSGNKVGFLSEEGGTVQIWEVAMDNGNPKQISNIKDGINGFEYSPTGEKVFYIKNVKLDKTPNDLYPDLPLVNVRIINNLMYRHWNAWHDYAYSHIFVADYSDGNIQEGKDIMEGETFDSPMSPYFDQSEISWSPDGKFIAYT